MNFCGIDYWCIFTFSSKLKVSIEKKVKRLKCVPAFNGKQPLSTSSLFSEISNYKPFLLNY